ncbi:Outer membrane protein assembly factor BamB, contains PQQ-like beta-propeller repeat [Eubacterium aggregans]|uniref:Outer membrane protein assembly factor BamB, contains PQQ-like beta-propeller repeat n=1 Tax=Eubacterium aggregans TaxID=81409 RepID=A0A1H4DDJ2_9FIRM|nr:PQQ-binding-like beta-propeller repeat protein [Eubacterium aggregans]SEA70794.1 Outer membrane protein assembly factor BamB, contains PQQ-like beta-propeller repeat [Eubacterium aggregans]
MKKKLISAISVLLVLLAVIGANVFAEDNAPKASFIVDGTQYEYKTGDTVAVKFAVSNTNITTAGFVLKYDTDKYEPIASTLGKCISTEYFDEEDGTGIFTKSSTYFVNDAANGLIGYTFNIDRTASDAKIKSSATTPPYRYLESGENGYTLCTVNLKAKKDVTLSASDFAFAKHNTTANRDVLIGLDESILNNVVTDISIPEPPKEGLDSLLVHTGTSPEGGTVLLQNSTDSYGEAPVFSADTLNYTLAAQTDSINQLRFRAKPLESGAMVTLKWGEADNQKKDITWTSGSSAWANCLVPGKNTLTLTVNPAEGSTATAKTYTLDVNVNPTLSALSAKAGDTSLNFDTKFVSTTNTYSAAVAETAKTLTLSATPKDSGYTVTYNGSSSSTVDISGTNKVDIAVTAGQGDKAITNTYTLNLVKKPVGTVTFKTTPADAIAKVYDSAGKSVTANTDGSFSGLFADGSYTYAVTKTGYVAQTGSVPVEGGTITADLKAAAADPTGLDATWPNFRGNAQNNGITTAQTPASAAQASTLWTAKLGTGWAASPTGQIIVDGDIVVCAGTSIYRLDSSTGAVKATGTMDASPGFAITNPIYADGMIFVQMGSGEIQAFNATTLESLWIYKDVLGGQANAPIAYADGYIYTGFWNGESRDANYVCLSVSDEDPANAKEEKTATWRHTQAGGFYWAGGVVVDDVIIVGTDDATGGFDGDSHLLSINRKTGAVVSDLTLTGLGDQRSTVVYDGGKLYFTTKNGYLCRATVDSGGQLSDLKSQNYPDVAKQATATPVVYGGRVYIGLGNGINAGGGFFLCCDANSLAKVYTVPMTDYPQGSVLLSTAYLEDTGYLYFYSTYNSNPGGLNLIKVKPNDTGATAEKVDLYTPDTDKQQYCISSVIAGADGTLYYKNDSGYIFAIESTTPVKALIKEIDAIGEVTLNSEAAITQAEADYAALSTSDKAQVTNYQTLVDARAKYDDLTAAKAVEDQINALPATVDKDSEAAVKAARKAYNDLSATQKTYVSPDALTKLEAAENQITLLDAKTAAKGDLEAYKSADLYRDAQKTELAAAIADGKTKIDAATTTDGVTTALTAAKAAIDGIKTDAELDIEEAKNLKTAQEAAVKVIETYKNKNDYRASEQKQLADTITKWTQTVNAITVENNDLAAAVAKINTAVASAKTEMDGIKTAAQYQAEEDKAAAAAVDAAIAALPAERTLTLADKDAVTAARSAYDALNANAKTYVTKLVTLKAAETKIVDLEAQAEADSIIVQMNAVIAQIEAKEASAVDAYNKAVTAYNNISATAREKAKDTKSTMDNALAKADAEQHVQSNVTTAEGSTVGVALKDKDGNILPLNVKLSANAEVKADSIAQAKNSLTGKDAILALSIGINKEELSAEQLAAIEKDGIMVVLSVDLTGYNTDDVWVAHIKDDGSVEKIKATYDAQGKTLSFITHSFSDFVVMATKITTPGATGTGTTANGVNTTKNTATGIARENSALGAAAVLVVIALGGGAALIWKRKHS